MTDDFLKRRKAAILLVKEDINRQLFDQGPMVHLQTDLLQLEILFNKVYSRILNKESDHELS